jgi:predicted amidohydrolase YtcJ
MVAFRFNIGIPNACLGNGRQFTAAALAANRYGWRLSPHIEGSDTLKTALDAYEAADRENSIHDKRWVLEHVPFATPDDLDRIAKLGVVVSAQYPGYDGPAPKDKASPIPLPMREFLNRRVFVSAGSDFLAGPNSSDDPFIPIYFYVTRKTRSGDVIVRSRRSAERKPYASRQSIMLIRPSRKRSRAQSSLENLQIFWFCRMTF